MIKHKWFSLIAACVMLVSTTLSTGGTALPAYAQGERTFPETGKTVKGRFLEYWDQNGGLPQQGLPISDEMQEVSEADGKTYTVQYFERAVFEKHPELKPPYDVLLSQLGVFYYANTYASNAPGQQASKDDPTTFAETGKTLGGQFRRYWEAHGGLAQQGYPISDEFQEKGKDGKTRTVQYFQRAVFEYHEEFAGTQNEVLLSLLGVSFYERKHEGGPPPEPGAGGGSFAVPGWTHVVATTNNMVFFYNSSDGSTATASIGADGTLTVLDDDGPGGFETGFTNVVAAQKNLIFFYNTKTGQAQFARMGDNGHTEAVNSSTMAAGWNLISIDVNSGLAMFYRADNGLWLWGRFADDGKYVGDIGHNVKFDPVVKITQMVPYKNGLWLVYYQAGGNGTILRMSPEGKIDPLKNITTFHKHWTHIVSDGSKLLFYDQEGGLGATAVLSDDGTFTQLQSFSGWNTYWTHVVATRNNVFVYYAASLGRVINDSIGEDGNFTTLKVYEPRK